MPTFQFTFSEDHLIQAHRRMQQSRRLRQWIVAVPLFVGAGLMAALTAHAGGIYVAIAIVLGAILLLPLLRVITEGSIRRNFRKSPFYNDSITAVLTAEGLHSVGQQGSTDLPWSSVTRIRRFPDGWLLFHGPGFGHWFPATTLTEGTVADVESLLNNCLSQQAAA